MTPTSRTLALLRGRGWICAVVEKWNAFAHIRQDVFGFGDLLCANPGPPAWIMLAQCCAADGGGPAERVAKIKAEPRARVWLKSGGAIHVYGWRRQKLEGKRMKYVVREIVINLDHNDAFEITEAV